MALDTFAWRTQIQSGMEGTFTHRVRTTQFGDGYKQVSGDGPNPEQQSWPVVLTGSKNDLIPALNFIRAHTVNAFIWTPPFGQAGLFRVAADSIHMAPVSNNAVSISATFEQAFHP